MSVLPLALWLAGVLLAGEASAPKAEFPASFARAASLGSARDPHFGGKLLGALEGHVRTLGGARTPIEAKAYLERAAGTADGAGLAARLGSGALSAEQAAAVLAASALARPDQFAQALDRLEDVRSGLGKAAARIVSSAEGGGDPRLIEALRSAVARQPRGPSAGYGDLGWAAVFDKARAVASAGDVAGRWTAQRPSGLERPGAAGIRVKQADGSFKTLSPAEVQAQFGMRLVPVMPSRPPEDLEQAHAAYRARQLRSLGDRPNHLSKIDFKSAIDQGRTADLYVAKVDEKVGHGLFAAARIKDGELIAEYTGDLAMNVTSAKMRGNSYLFNLPSGENRWYVDAERAGNYARFANHSSSRPNATVMFGYHNGYYHVLLIAGRDISPDEQILYDYGEDYWSLRDKPADL